MAGIHSCRSRFSNHPALKRSMPAHQSSEYAGWDTPPPSRKAFVSWSRTPSAPSSIWWAPPKYAGPASCASTGACSGGSEKRRVAGLYSTYPALAIPPSHSRAYRSLILAVLASSALVAGPCAASVLKRPRRSPSAARTVVVRPLVSARTLPANAWTLSESTVVLVMAAPPCGRVGRWSRTFLPPTLRERNGSPRLIPAGITVHGTWRSHTFVATPSTADCDSAVGSCADLR